MADNKNKLHNTEMGNLITNLRGEVGDILLTWITYRKLKVSARILTTNDPIKDMENPGLILLRILIDKLENDIVSRLSELAEYEIGRLTFYFAQQKLTKEINLTKEVSEFRRFVEGNKFKAKRNQYISHKQLPEKWQDHKEIFIPLATVGKCVALAVQLMIKIDKVFLGPNAIYFWREILKKKSKPIVPLNVNFFLLPYMRLPDENQRKIFKEEY